MTKQSIGLIMAEISIRFLSVSFDAKITVACVAAIICRALQ